ncbi:MAG: hypothetical protein EBR73_17190, partial [Rhodobacteraceae bacterium]|nr:hypothetical protein [Paracoccaceae bacterium]
MSIQFIVNGEYVTPKDAKDKRVIAAQMNELNANRLAGEQFQGNLLSIAANEGRISASMKQSAINEQIDLMYREIDNTPAFEPKAFGNQALLSRLLSEAVPVNVGKKVVKMRRVSEAGLANIS